MQDDLVHSALNTIEKCWLDAKRALAVREQQTQSLRQSLYTIEQSRNELALDQDWSSRQLNDLEQACIEFLLLHSNLIILYGARALNEYLPAWLQVGTFDFDCFVNAQYMDKLIQDALDFFQDRFPHRKVWWRNALHNPDHSKTILISQRPVLDLSVLKHDLGKTPQGRLGLRCVSVGWLFENLQAMTINDSARYRWPKDKERLLRLCFADQHGLLMEPLPGDRDRALLQLGDPGIWLHQKHSAYLESIVQAKKANQAAYLLEQQLAQTTKSLHESHSKQRQLEADLASRDATIEDLKRQLQDQVKKTESLAQQSKARQENKAKQIGLLEAKLQQANATLERDKAQATLLQSQLLRRAEAAELHVREIELAMVQVAVAPTDELRKTKEELERLNQVEKKSRVAEAVLNDMRTRMEATTKELAFMRETLKERNMEHETLHAFYCALRNQVETTFATLAIPHKYIEDQSFHHFEDDKSWVVQDNGKQTRVWLCVTCRDYFQRPGCKGKGAVLKLRLRDQEISLPVQRTDRKQYICNTCFYDNLLQTFREQSLKLNSN